MGPSQENEKPARDSLFDAERASPVARDVAIALSFLNDESPFVREHSLAKVVHHRAELTHLPPEIVRLVFEETLPHLVADALEVVGGCVSNDPAAAQILAYCARDSRPIICQSAITELRQCAEIPRSLSIVLSATDWHAEYRKLSTHSVEVTTKGSSLMRHLESYRLREVSFVQPHHFTVMMEALVHPDRRVQDFAVETIARVQQRLTPSQRTHLETICAFASESFLTEESSRYNCFLDLLREVSESHVLARIVGGVEPGANLDLRIIRDFTALYLSRAAPHPVFVSAIGETLWHSNPEVVKASASNIGILVEEVPEKFARQLLATLAEALVERAGEGKGITQAMVRGFERQTLYAADVLGLMNAIVERGASRAVLLGVVDVLRKNPPMDDQIRPKMAVLLRGLAASYDAAVAEAARQLLRSNTNQE